MNEVGYFLLGAGGVVWFFIFLWCAGEEERLPWQYLQWKPYMSEAGYPNKGKIVVGIRRKGSRVPLWHVTMNADNFEEELMEASSNARARCIIANNEIKVMQRAMPK